MAVDRSMVRRESVVRMASSAGRAHIMLRGRRDHDDGDRVAPLAALAYRSGRTRRLGGSGHALRARTTFGRVALRRAVMAAGVATAQTAEQSNRTDEMSFMAADTNGDGLVDEAELAADQAKRFKQLDTNGDGYLTPDELEAHDRRSRSWRSTATGRQISFIEAMTAKMDDFMRADTNRDGRVSYKKSWCSRASSEHDHGSPYPQARTSRGRSLRRSGFGRLCQRPGLRHAHDLAQRHRPRHGRGCRGRCAGWAGNCRQA